MAVQIIRINSQVSVPNQTTKIIADIAVSTVSELPAANGIDNYTLLDTSIALVRQTGDFYTLDGGTWYAADGSGEADGNRSLSMSALSASPVLTRSVQHATIDTADTDPGGDEIEQAAKIEAERIAEPETEDTEDGDMR